MYLDNNLRIVLKILKPNLHSFIEFILLVQLKFFFDSHFVYIIYFHLMIISLANIPFCFKNITILIHNTYCIYK